jgi:hypothetical protein
MSTREGYRLGKIAGQKLNGALARHEAYVSARVTALVERIAEKRSRQPMVETLRAILQNHLEATQRRPSLIAEQGLTRSSARH